MCVSESICIYYHNFYLHAFLCVCIDCLYIKDVSVCVYVDVCDGGGWGGGGDCLCEWDHTLKALSVQ